MSRAPRRAGAALLLSAACACGGGAPRAGEAPREAPSWQAAADASYAGIEPTPVALSGGRWEGEPFTPEGSARPLLLLVPDFWLSEDLDGDGLPEALVLLASQGGGTGSVLYLAALTYRAGEVVNRGTAVVGDRVQVRAARAEQGRIELDVVQAGPDDAMCCPGEKATRSFAREGEALVEVDARVTGRLVPGDLSGVEWLLTQLAEGEPAPAEPEVTLVVAREQAGGRGGCNRYFAQLRAGQAPGEISIGPIGSTRMACPEPGQSLEARYLDALGRAAKFSFVAGQLALTSRHDDRIETLRFRARPLEAAAP
jgi:heat shock protein HslJ